MIAPVLARRKSFLWAEGGKIRVKLAQKRAKSAKSRSRTR
jgi:hypothetical protein